ncbi:unnamed protein product [Closterium sp. NIES-54]
MGYNTSRAGRFSYSNRASAAAAPAPVTAATALLVQLQPLLLQLQPLLLPPQPLLLQLQPCWCSYSPCCCRYSPCCCRYSPCCCRSSPCYCSYSPAGAATALAAAATALAAAATALAAATTAPAAAAPAPSTAATALLLQLQPCCCSYSPCCCCYSPAGAATALAAAATALAAAATALAAAATALAATTTALGDAAQRASATAACAAAATTATCSAAAATAACSASPANAAGAGGAGGTTGSAGGVAGAGGAGPTTDRHCLSWPQPRQLQQLGVDSGGHCLSRTTPPLSSFASGFFSEPVQVLGALVFYVLRRGGNRVAALGASESAAALGASESAAALGARASPALGPSSAEALHTFTLDSGASRCFFCDCTSLTPLAAPVPISLADPIGGPVVARASTVLPCPAVPSDSLLGLHLPTFSTNLVSNAAIQDVWVDTFIPGGQRVAICTCSRTGRHLATFTRWPGSSLYTLTTASAQVATAGLVVASSQVSASGQLAASCSCRVLSHQTLLWHNRLGHPSLPRLRGMHSRLLVSGLPRSLPSLPRSPAPPCLPCVEGRQCAAPHSSEFPPTTAPLQTLHMDVWGPAPIGGTDQERYFLLVVDDYTRYTTVFPLRRKADVSGVLIPWIRAIRRQLREQFSQDFPVLHLHSDRGGEFSSDLLAEFCRDEGIVQSFTLLASPQQNGIAEHRIGLIMEVARTSMVHAAAPHFLWLFAVRYAAHKLNLWPRVSEPETSPTLRWRGKVGDASVFWVWGALSLVRDAKANKLSSRTLRCVFLGFPTDAPPWIHPHTSHPGPALSGVSQVDLPPLVEPLEVSSDSSGPAEGGDPAADDTAATRRSPRLETPPGFLPRPSSPPLQPAAVDSGAETAGAESGDAEPEAGSWGAASGGADSRGPASPSGGGAVGDLAGGPGAGQPPLPDLLETLSLQAICAWIVWRGSLGGGGYGPAGAGAASPGGTDGAGGTGGTAGAGGAASARGTRGAAGARGAGASSPRGATSAASAGPTSPGGTASAGGAGGIAGARGAGAGGTTGAGAAGAGGTTGAGGAGGATGAASTGGAGGTTGARGHRATGASGAAGAGGAGGAAGGAGAGGAGVAGTALRKPFFYPQPQSSLPPPDSVLHQVLSLPSSTGLPLPLLCPPTDQSQPQLLPGSPLPAPGPHTEVIESLTERREPKTRAFTPVHARRVAHPRPPAVPGTHGMALRPSSVPKRVVLPEPPASSLPHVSDPESDLARAASPTVTRLLATVVTDPDLESTAAFALVTELVDFAARSRLDYVASLVTESESVCPPSVGGELALGSDVLEDRQFELECLAATLHRFASMLLCPEGDPDALDIPTPCSYAKAIAGEFFSQWQTAMDVEMASWKSTGTYVDEVPPPWANIVDGMWIFRVKRPPGSPPAFKARYVVRGFTQRDYELHSLDFSTAFMQGSLHEEIWLRCPPGFTGSFPASTQWSLWRPVYGLRQAPREWHDTLRTTLAALGGPLTALALVKAELQERHTCTDLGGLTSYLGLQITQDRARHTITLTQSHMVHQVLQRFAFHFSSPQPTPLSTGHSLSTPPSDESVEPSGLYPELLGCLMYLMACTRPDLAYPLSLLAHYVAPVLTGHSDASWADDQATQRSSQGYTFSLGSSSVSWRSTRSSSVLSSSCEAEIYVGAMAAQELRWLTYLLTDLGERPRSPPFLYADNKAMIALCNEQRLEHRTKHIALRYFLARELQQRRQLRLSYVASRANTAYVFTKALGSGDHQRFCTALGLVPTLPHLLVA